ncbi:NRPS-like enzyme [Mollisia scopiformis]|uniref:NRPS-like enzyme n=1 Tax=Mollisia scopiformis TaxID=149040 RepID=A0A194WWU6_MOLSC|nr:NRPS-like enzyme [Mollisia scopiformis]KUJ12451.1 NRPS-like enzyme [Mollisia scopiformis]
MATEHARRSQWKNDLLPHIVDRLARETPEALYAEYPVSPSTYDEVLTYVGPNDFRYTVLVLAAVKVGYVLFLTSPRNSLAAHLKLFHQLNCTKLLYPEPKPASVSAILESHYMQHFAVPSVEDLLGIEYPVYPYDKKFEEAMSEPLMVIHTSGSTGFPKALIYSHEGVARNMNMLAKDPPEGLGFMDRLVQGKRVLNCFPPFHGACLASHLFAAIPFGTVMIAPLAGTIPTAQGIVDALHHTSAHVALIVPSIIHELNQDAALLDYCAQNLERCLYAGGDLPQAVGDKVASKLPLICQYRASEIGMTPQLLPKEMTPYDWKYVFFHPCLGTEFRDIADGNYELYVKHDPEKESEQPTFTVFPHLKEYGSRDLFKQHPTIPNLWSWSARADDIIVFLNGEKTNPNSMEQHIVARNPEVSAAIVVGTQRFQAALMIEAATTAQPQSIAGEATFIERIWPSIEEANRLAPAYTRVEKFMVLPLSSKKPVIRAGKGTIQRVATILQYSAELDRVYQNADINSDVDDFGITIRVQDIKSISQAVRAIVIEATGYTELDDHTNFFAIGLDSLHGLKITRMLRQRLRISDVAIATVYNHPSIAQLSNAILSLQISKQNLQTREKQARAQSLTSIFEEYRDCVHDISQPTTRVVKRPEKHFVVLTGSTGSLGGYLLEALLNDPSVDYIYCLDRKNDNRSPKIHRHNATILTSRQNHTRVTFLEVDLAQSNLGLDSEAYNSILESATLIIHNAWPVNFNLSLDAFRPQLTGLLNLFTFSASARYKPALFFISSISSVLGLRTPSRLTFEEVVTTTDAPFSNGFENPDFIARVGQIAGPVLQPGLWNPAEWLPSLVMSSIRINALPDSLGAGMSRVDWIPVDLLAEIIVDISLHHDGNLVCSGAEVLHLRNLKVTTWEALLPDVKSIIDSITSKNIAVVPAKSWLANIRQDFESTLKSKEGNEGEKVADEELETLLKANPAIKLLDFFSSSFPETEEVNVLALEKTLSRSEPLRSLGGVSSSWMQKWIAEWLLS